MFKSLQPWRTTPTRSRTIALQRTGESLLVYRFSSFAAAERNRSAACISGCDSLRFIRWYSRSICNMRFFMSYC
jgi:hypothetical protein